MSRKTADTSAAYPLNPIHIHPANCSGSTLACSADGSKISPTCATPSFKIVRHPLLQVVEITSSSSSAGDRTHSLTHLSLALSSIPRGLFELAAFSAHSETPFFLSFFLNAPSPDPIPGLGGQLTPNFFVSQTESCKAPHSTLQVYTVW